MNAWVGRTFGRGEAAAAVAVLFLGLIEGCPARISAEQACTDLATARCGRISVCSPDALTTSYGDLATCEARESAACLGRLALAGTSATPSFTEGCALAIPFVSCRAFFANAPPLACIAPPGRFADGHACSDDAQCTNGTCNRASDALCGSCGSPATGGESCVARSCAHGLVCVSGACAQPAANGSACDDQTPCQLGGSCVFATQGQPGTCQSTVSQPGMPCDATRTTMADCNQARQLFCDPASSTCAAIFYASSGEVCDGNGIRCDALSLCAPAMDAGTDRCVPRSPDGGPCGDSQPPCVAPARCAIPAGATQGSCQLTDAAFCS
jgi:hypothetical protein